MQILQGDCIEVLKTLPDQSVHTCVTSPPYYGLRDYGTAKWEGGSQDCEHNPQRPDGGDRADRSLPLGRGGVYRDVCSKCGARRIDDQIGLEPTPAEYVAKLVSVFREVKRVLRNDGTLWLNLGDSYASSPVGHKSVESLLKSTTCVGYTEAYLQGGKFDKSKLPGFKPKDLLGIPWRVAFALQADGWYLRSDIVWHKPNPMPSSAKDRPTVSHEYIFLLAKSRRYYYDFRAILEIASGYDGRKDTKYKGGEKDMAGGAHERWAYTINGVPARNKRSVWTVTTKPYKEAHFATFPPDLIEPCVLAGCPVGGTVLDPFNGSGTTGYVALKNNRDYIGIELNQEYIELTHKRLATVQPTLEVE